MERSIKKEFIKNLIIDFVFQRYVQINKQVEKEFIEFVRQKREEFSLMDTPTCYDATQTLYKTLCCFFKAEEIEIERKRQVALQKKREYMKKQNMLRQQQTKQLQNEVLKKKQKIHEQGNSLAMQHQQQIDREVKALNDFADLWNEDMEQFADLELTNEHLATLDSVETMESNLQNKISQNEVLENEVNQEEIPIVQEEVPVVQEKVPVVQEKVPIVQEEVLVVVQEEVPVVQEEVLKNKVMQNQVLDAPPLLEILENKLKDKEACDEPNNKKMRLEFYCNRLLNE
ncbi:ORF9 [Lymantria xylina nucleopolyhedrovirus]|uniref:ORF9 n=1 Tax=Lymantria xylina multiple nucleopolyhedrovirus TaxID=2847840 RepID=D4N246_9ABAC|nr:ORF9 [Lymantria xylina nucleopolyhedrovirus]ADD73718.1 ORF9 [Lymantria xylina nucleopolyhedrovirus]